MTDIVEQLLETTSQVEEKSQETTSPIEENIEEKIKEIIKPECPKCNRAFTSKKVCDKHILTQICIPLNRKTYCKLCFITFEDRKQYNKHVMSEEHFNRVNGIEVDKFDLPTNEAHSVDPYLDKSDVEKINDLNIGDGFAICFKDDSYHQVEFDKARESPEIELDTEVDETSNVEEKLKQEIDDRMNPTPLTDVQVKVLNFLKQSSGKDNLEKNFLKAINQIRIEDYKGLSTAIISCECIPILEKQKYIQTIRLFKQLLEKKLSNGVVEHNGKSIKKILEVLTV